MNWLAHTFLSAPDVEFRLGNLFADMIKRQERVALPARFQAGMQQHYRIDAFTDSHPIVHRSRARIRGDYRHTRGIIVDVFYDHFLSLAWDHYCSQPLTAFAADVYGGIQTLTIPLPAEAMQAGHYIIRENRLASYRTTVGIESALRLISERLSARTGRSFSLGSAVGELTENFDALRQDFAEFFPLLQTHVATTGEPTRQVRCRA